MFDYKTDQLQTNQMRGMLHVVFRSSHGSVRTSLLILCLIAVGLVGTPAWGQDLDDFETKAEQLKPAEVTRLRAVLDTPIPANARHETVRQLITDKESAAHRLGDPRAYERVMREGISLLPDAYLRARLASNLTTRREYEGAEVLYRDAMAAESDPYLRIRTKALFVYLLYLRRDMSRLQVEASAAQVEGQALLRGALKSWQRYYVLSAQSLLARTVSLMHEYVGKSEEAIAQAQEAVRTASENARQLEPSLPSMYRQVASTTLLSAVQRVVSANRVAGKLQEAETALASYSNLAAKEARGGVARYPIFQLGSEIRYAQRDFNGALRYADRALELAHEAKVPLRQLTAVRIDRIRSLIGLRRYSDAAAVFDEFDALAKAEPKLASSLLYRLDRGIVRLGLGQWSAAAQVLERGLKAYEVRYGSDHPSTVSTSGLLGVAKWRGGKPEEFAQARNLLREAVQDYLNLNTLFAFENQGVNPVIRRWIFEAYLEAAAQAGPDEAMAALGAADALAASGTQLAVGDAAVRAAASTPQLSALVREEQDIRNETLSLRNYLAGEAGTANSSVPQVASQMRARLAKLETQRRELLNAIRRDFPDFDRLVRPAVPKPEEVSGLLKRNQAMLVLYPAGEQVYAWAIGSDGAFAFHRVPKTLEALAAQVRGLRSSLELSPEEPFVKPFQTRTAFELYRDLVAPLDQVLSGKDDWIVVAHGPLAQIPFGLLLKADPGQSLAQAQWLIKSAAISHAPSISAWLQLQRAARRQMAQEPLLAWGDPVFGGRTSSGLTQRKRDVAVTRSAAAGGFDQPAAASVVRYSSIPALPETREELRAIGRVLGANLETDIVLGEKATRQSVLEASQRGLLSRKRVVAFATHGLMAGDLPGLREPALALAADGQESSNPLAPLLRLEDVLGLKLNADWVLLSACNTAAADGQAEEALSGLARGFFYAGSRSLLVTHWAVETESALMLTTGTFAHQAGNPSASKAASLRQAMLDVMALPRYAHPAFWAPYVLVGDGNR